MALPSLEQYNEALQNHSHSLIDPELKAGKVRTSVLGLPFAACGGFALTYTITCASGKKYAVRCFHKEARDLGLRYQAISRRLTSLHSPYFVDFEFQERGINVRNAAYPIVKMAWAHGQTLGEFLEECHDQKPKVMALKSSLATLARHLEANHIAHGDIQPGNLMIDENGKSVQLVDYDGMYLPEIKVLGAEETGYLNFQHPQRARINPWNERLDRFPFILLTLVLTALEADPAIWRTTFSDSDHFLFSANDFANPAGSTTFMALRRAGLGDKADSFAAICQADFNSIPTLDDFLGNSITIQGNATGNSGASRRYISTYAVLDAQDYNLCLGHVGDMVELVGKVESVKFGRTHLGAPYYFINFGDWKENSVKITVWSDYLRLDKSKSVKFNKFKGKYISIIGMMQPPYSNPKYGYSHLYINLEPNVPFREISEEEAAYRLDYEKPENQRREKPQSRKEPEDRKIISCPSCDQKLRIGRHGILKVSCPTCKNTYLYDADHESVVPSGEDHSNKSADNGENDDILRQMRQQKQASADSGTTIIACPICFKNLRVRSSGCLEVSCPRCMGKFKYDTQDGRFYEIRKHEFQGSSQQKAPRQGANTEINAAILNKIRQTAANEGQSDTGQPVSHSKAPPSSSQKNSSFIIWLGIVCIVLAYLLFLAK